MSDERLLLLGVIGGAALIMTIAGLALRRGGLWWRVGVPAAGLLGPVMVPEIVRDWFIALLLALLVGSSGSGWAMLITFGLSMVVAAWIPGGLVALGLAIFAVCAWIAARSQYRHLARLRRARDLVPGEKPSGDVEIGGTVTGPRVALPIPRSSVPRIEGDVAWWRTKDGDEIETSGALRLETDAGTVLVEIDDVEVQVDLRLERGIPLSRLDRDEDQSEPEEASESDQEEQEKRWIHLCWITIGEEAYVVGRPEWEMAPPDMRGYRDGPVVPVFRGKNVFFADKSEATVRRDAIWGLTAWAVWSGATTAVAALLLAGII